MRRVGTLSRCMTAICHSTTGDRSRYRGRMKSVETVKRTVCVVLAFLAVPAAALVAEELNAIILRVNDEIATRYDYDQRKQARLRALAESSLSAEEVTAPSKRMLKPKLFRWLQYSSMIRSSSP